MTLPDFHDATGAPIPRGRSLNVLRYTATGATAPPAWLATQGTRTVSGGYLRVSGAAQVIYMRTPGVDLRQVETLSFTVESVTADWYSYIAAGLSLKDDGNTAGVSIFQQPTGQPTCVLRLVGAGVPDIPIRYLWAGPNLLRHRNLTIAVGTADKSVFLIEDDQVMHYGVYPQMVLGPVRGVLDANVTAPSGQTRELRAAQVTFAAEIN